MELKDMILSTLAELDGAVKKEEELKSEEIQLVVNTFEIKEESIHVEVFEPVESEHVAESQRQFYLSLRERILVLFEGFQSPNNKNIEAKIDLTLNFLEYLLASIDEHLESMDNQKNESLR
ncbi:MAG: hypothetical protein J0647_06955 [Campylobacteraceae bacterium]|nr:hypothetical protein [Campylobacteraceae bacterium]